MLFAKDLGASLVMYGLLAMAVFTIMVFMIQSGIHLLIDIANMLTDANRRKTECEDGAV